MKQKSRQYNIGERINNQISGTEETAQEELHKHFQLIFGKETKGTQYSKDSFLSKWCWKNWILKCKRKKLNLDTDLTTFTKLNQINKYLNEKCKTIKCLEDNIGENFDNIGYDDHSLDLTLKAQFMEEIIDMCACVSTCVCEYVCVCVLSRV